MGAMASQITSVTIVYWTDYKLSGERNLAWILICLNLVDNKFT